MTEEEKRIAEKAGLPTDNTGLLTPDQLRKLAFDLQEDMKRQIGTMPTAAAAANWMIAARLAIEGSVVNGVQARLAQVLKEISPQTGFEPGTIEGTTQMLVKPDRLHVIFTVYRSPISQTAISPEKVTGPVK